MIQSVYRINVPRAACGMPPAATLRSLAHDFQLGCLRHCDIAVRFRPHWPVQLKVHCVHKHGHAVPCGNMFGGGTSGQAGQAQPGRHMHPECIAGPGIATPHIAEPHKATPHIAGPHMGAPHMAGPGMATPHIAGPCMATHVPQMADLTMADPSMENPNMACARTALPHMAIPHMADAHTAASLTCT
eukprot:366470-Chlamydomonas_euryale.AAC.15